jgi:hypothetical protein
MGAVSLSANLDERQATLVRKLAGRENRTVSNFVASAVIVFASLPKELRDALLELRCEENTEYYRELVREMSALVARRRLDAAFRRVAEEATFPDLPDDATEFDILDEASKLSR